MNLKQRSYEKELLDDDDIPFDAIRKNMEELNFINTWLGGHKITTDGIEKFAAKNTEIHVCEIGCGGGDNLVAILRWCNKKNISVRFTGIDIKAACIEFAQTRAPLKGITTWMINDYKKVLFEVKPHIIFSSLFCHHFSNEELAMQLRWMQENAINGFFINDLQRHWLAYHSIKILTRIFSKSYMVKYDAPLSVARSFTKSDWNEIFELAGIRKYSIEWKWAFRYLIIVAK